ncbi:hypothetical protein Ddye_022420, partial [Dipteronia dyeriana]
LLNSSKFCMVSEAMDSFVDIHKYRVSIAYEEATRSSLKSHRKEPQLYSAYQTRSEKLHLLEGSNLASQMFLLRLKEVNQQMVREVVRFVVEQEVEVVAEVEVDSKILSRFVKSVVKLDTESISVTTDLINLLLPDPSWYIDSGATNHITPNFNNLSINNEYR